MGRSVQNNDIFFFENNAVQHIRFINRARLMRKVKQAAALPCKADTLKNKFPIHTFQNVKNKLISLIWARANNIEGPAHIMKYEF